MATTGGPPRSALSVTSRPQRSRTSGPSGAWVVAGAGPWPWAGLRSLSPVPVVLHVGGDELQQGVGPVPVLALLAQVPVGGLETGQGGRFAVDQAVDHRHHGDQIQAFGQEAAGGRDGRSGVGGGEAGGQVARGVRDAPADDSAVLDEER